MIASLLPGLRDVRTPLTVGYLWAGVIWLLFGDHWPISKPEGSGLIPKLFVLEATVGKGASFAAVSFAAYLVGALFSVPLEGRIGSYLLEKSTPLLSDRMRVHDGHLLVIEKLEEELKQKEQYTSPESAQEIREELQRSINGETLRIRLLVASQSLYGEYDRLAAEAGFRFNIAVPLVILAWIVAADAGLIWGIMGTIISTMLMVQGLRRGVLANEILRRALGAGIIQLPVADQIRQIM